MKLTLEQFLEQYGEVTVTFVFYYKYEFLFKGNIEDKEISIGVGGSSDDIYKFQVSNKPVTINYLNCEVCLLYGHVEENNTVISEFTNY